MASLPLILSLLSALAAASDALWCIQCTSPTSPCTGFSMTCPQGYLCGSSYAETTVGRKRSSYERACALPSECNFTGSISMQEGITRAATTCCSTDNCKPTLPVLPPISSNPNGLVCRSCISANSTWCYTSDTIQCTGEENKCLLQTTKVTGSNPYSRAIRGCATKSFCDIGSQSYSGLDSTTRINYICTNGGLSVHSVVLTPAIACLLLVKFFF